MPIGDIEGDIEPEILGLGFPFTNELTILGFILNNNDTFVEKNYKKVLRKIDNIIRFWERFNLSIPGKISIYKTLLIPQINFIASILTPGDVILDRLEKLMDSFVTKGLNISLVKKYTAASRGGLGLFKLKNFISALQVTWINRAVKNTNDNWKLALKNCGNGNVLECYKYTEIQNSGVAIQNIIRSYQKFVDCFYKYGNNFLKDKIFENIRYGTGRNQSTTFDVNFFGQIIPEAALQMTWSQLLLNGNFCDYASFQFITGLTVRREQYTQIKKLFFDKIEKGWKL